MDFLSLLYLPVACLPGRGAFSHTEPSVCAAQLPTALPPRAGVSASSPISGPLIPLVLLFQRPSLTCSGLPRGLAPLVCPRSLTLPSLRPPRLLIEHSQGPVHGWVFIMRKWEAGRVAAWHRLPASGTWMPMGWGSQPGGESWMGREWGILNWKWYKQPATNCPQRVPKASVRTEFVMCAHVEGLRLTVNKASH